MVLPRAKAVRQKVQRLKAATRTAPKLLTDTEVSNLAILMKERFGWQHEPRDFQLMATRAQLEGKDTVVHAPTGMGKTAVAAGPHVWDSSKGKATILVSPLIALQDEMVETFRVEFNLKAIAVNSARGGCSRAVIKDLLSGKYSIILISPEMLQSRHFINNVLRNHGFSNRVLSVVVDEAHCVSHWGDSFRKKYGSLGIIRAFLGKWTPIVAMSASFTPRVKRDVVRKLQLSSNHIYLNLGNDRSNVSIVARSIHNAINSYTDLHFVIPEHVTSASQVPKTLIYADNINTGTEIIDYLRKLLPPHLANAGIVRPYNATLSNEYRNLAMTEYRAGTIRILVCTDAARMGCNIPDVDVVVQWKLPAKLSSFVQRAGRAARAPGRQGIAILLAEPAAYNVVLDTAPPETPIGSSGAAPAGIKKGRKGSRRHHHTSGSKVDRKLSKSYLREYAKMHGRQRGNRTKLDSLPNCAMGYLDPESENEGIYNFVQATSCRRGVLTCVYENQQPNPLAPCCDICSPELLDRARPGTPAKNAALGRITKGEICNDVLYSLEDWDEGICARDLQHTFITSILPSSIQTLLASLGPLTKKRIESIVEPRWPVYWSKYGCELTAHLLSLDIPPFRPLPKTNTRSKHLKPIATTPIDNNAPQVITEKARKRLAEHLGPTEPPSNKRARAVLSVASTTIPSAPVSHPLHSSQLRPNFSPPYTFSGTPLYSYPAVGGSASVVGQIPQWSGPMDNTPYVHPYYMYPGGYAMPGVQPNHPPKYPQQFTNPGQQPMQFHHWHPPPPPPSSSR